MSFLLLGRWDWSENLVIEGSHQVPDGDQAAIDQLVNGQSNSDGSAWAATFDVDSHKAAVQAAYDTYVSHLDDGTELTDQVHGFVPETR